MQAVEDKGSPRREKYVGSDGGDVMVHKIAHLRSDEREAREEHHAPGVILRCADDGGVHLTKRLEGADPSEIRFKVRKRSGAVSRTSATTSS